MNKDRARAIAGLQSDLPPVPSHVMPRALL
jgi:hypothetical protein